MYKICINCGTIFDYIYINNNNINSFSDFKYKNINIYKIYLWDSYDYKNKILNNINNYLLKICYNKNISKYIQDYAIIIFKKIINYDGKINIIRGINRKSIIAGCLYLSCRKNNNLLLFNEISDYFSISKKNLIKGIKKILNNDLNIELGEDNAEIYLKKFINDLNIKNIYLNELFLMLYNLEKMNLVNDHKPISIAYVIIYIFLKNYNKLYLFNKLNYLNIADNTFKKIYNKIKKYEKILNSNNLIIEQDFDLKNIDIINEYKKKFNIS